MDAADVARLWEGTAESWARQARAGRDVYRDAVNTPGFLGMLPEVAGLEGLDVGCGEGSNTRLVAARGARMIGLDVAPTFVRHAVAREREAPLGIGFAAGDGMRLPFGDGRFDFATAFMSLMDMPDPAAALLEVQRVLRPGGFVQFSILHPCFAPPHRKVLRDADRRPVAIEVGDYFARTGGRLETWWFPGLSGEEREAAGPFRLPLFHWTLGEWVSMIAGAGLTIEAFGEPSVDAETAARVPAVADTRIAPLFLIVRARKAGRGVRNSAT